MIRESIRWLKYFLIIMKSMVTGNQVVNWFGQTFVVYGNICKRIK